MMSRWSEESRFRMAALVLLLALLWVNLSRGDSAAAPPAEDGLPAAVASESEASGVVLSGWESLRFENDENQQLGRIGFKMISNPEMQVIAGPSQRLGQRSVVVWEAQSHEDVGTATGFWVASADDSHAGGISIYVDDSTRVFITDQGLMIRDGHRLAIGDERHYLYRCGDDLCWHDGDVDVNLTE